MLWEKSKIYYQYDRGWGRDGRHGEAWGKVRVLNIRVFIWR